MPFWLGALLAFLVVAIYVFVGGLRAIGFTNVFQGLLMVIAAWVVGIAIPEQLPGLGKTLADSPETLIALHYRFQFRVLLGEFAKSSLVSDDFGVAEQCFQLIEPVLQCIQLIAYRVLHNL